VKRKVSCFFFISLEPSFQKICFPFFLLWTIPPFPPDSFFSPSKRFQHFFGIYTGNSTLSRCILSHFIAAQIRLLSWSSLLLFFPGLGSTICEPPPLFFYLYAATISPFSFFRLLSVLVFHDLFQLRLSPFLLFPAI